MGYDVHQLAPGRPLLIGGVKVPSSRGSVGHSDGDALSHAITDAILGACRMGDIGEKFSDKSKRYKDIRSTILLSKVIKDIKSKKEEMEKEIEKEIFKAQKEMTELKKSSILSIQKISENKHILILWLYPIL